MKEYIFELEILSCTMGIIAKKNSCSVWNTKIRLKVMQCEMSVYIW